LATCLFLSTPRTPKSRLSARRLAKQYDFKRGGDVPSARSPERDKAYEIYLQHGGNITNRQIAEQLSIDERVVAVWKNRDGWVKKTSVVQHGNERCTTQAKPRNKKRKPGGQPGNKNAVDGNGGPPPRNQNAAKHGVYANVFFDTLDVEEWDLIDNLPADELAHLFDEVKLLTVRERRLMRKIQQIQVRGEKSRGLIINSVIRSEKKREFDSEADEKLYNRIQQERIADGKKLPGRTIDVSTATYDNSDLLLRAHAELTRVQSQKARVLAQIHQMDVTRERIDLERRKLDLELAKVEFAQQVQVDENEDSSSNFLEAMGGAVSDIWGGGDGAENG